MELCYEQLLPLPASKVFSFFESPANLQILMGSTNGFRLLAHSQEVRLGATIWFEITVAACVPVVLGFRNTIYEPPLRFGEELIHGPFDCFQHIHEFHPTNEGTVVRDRLKIRLHRIYGGEVITRLLVAPSFDRAFATRQRELQHLMNCGAPALEPRNNRATS